MYEGERSAAMLAIKRLAGVTPELDVRECKLHSHQKKANKAESTLVLKLRGDLHQQKSKTYVSVASKQDTFMCPPKTLFFLLI